MIGIIYKRVDKQHETAGTKTNTFNVNMGKIKEKWNRCAEQQVYCQYGCPKSMMQKNYERHLKKRHPDKDPNK